MPKKPTPPTDEKAQDHWLLRVLGTDPTPPPGRGDEKALLFILVIFPLIPPVLVGVAFRALVVGTDGPLPPAGFLLVGLVAAVSWWFLGLPLLREYRRLSRLAAGATPAPAPEPGPAPGAPRERFPWLILLLLILGGVSFDFVPHWRLNRLYAEGRCVVLDERAKEVGADNEGRGSAWKEFLIRYEAGGREHEAWARPTVDTTPFWRWPKEPLAVGGEYPCWYDPADPSRVMVGRGYGSFGIGSLSALGWVSFFGIAIRRRRVARLAAEGGSGWPHGVRGAAARAGPRPGEPEGSLGRLARPVLEILAFGIIAGAWWAWFFDGPIWYAMAVGGLIGLVAGLVMGLLVDCLWDWP